MLFGFVEFKLRLPEIRLVINWSHIFTYIWTYEKIIIYLKIEK